MFQLGIPNVDRRARSLLEYFLIVLNQRVLILRQATRNKAHEDEKTKPEKNYDTMALAASTN